MKSESRLRLGCLLVVAVVLSSCGGVPRHAERRVEQISSLVFEGGPEGAVVLVNGAEVSKLGKKSTTVPIADGTHQVRVIAGARVLYDRSVFIQDGTQKVIPLAPAR